MLAERATLQARLERERERRVEAEAAADAARAAAADEEDLEAGGARSRSGGGASVEVGVAGEGAAAGPRRRMMTVSAAPASLARLTNNPQVGAERDVRRLSIVTCVAPVAGPRAGGPGRCRCGQVPAHVWQVS